MKGESVVVMIREEQGRDALDNAVFEWSEQCVENVLVAPGDVDNIVDSTRPDGSVINYTLYFPKSYEWTNLENAEIQVRGECFKVIGRPNYWDEQNCPTDWNMVVKIGTTHG